MKLPALFEENMKQLLGEEFPAYLACLDKPRYYGLRVNTAKISTERFRQLCPFPIRPIPWIPNGFYYDGARDVPSRHPYYFAGLYYLQEPSAMTPASRLPIEPGDRVLDVCAAPGGKATELGARLLGRGVLAANDISSSRAKGLLKNIEVFGIGNALVLSEEPGKLERYFPAYFDKILIDAPCSGEGMFRKDARMTRAWEEHGPEYFSAIQKSILAQAARMLKPGGMMLYSTCTFDARENERMIDGFLREDPSFHVIPMEGYEGFAPGRPELTESKNPEIAYAVRIFPHRMQGEGHFLALLQKEKEPGRRQGGDAAHGKRAAFSRRIPEELEEFLRHIRIPFDRNRLEVHGEHVYYMPEGLPDMRGIRFLRTGLFVGELKKHRFEPSQALAMYLTKEDYDQTLDLPVTDERITRYLKGETLAVLDLVGGDEKGWRLLCVDGYPLGWGKLSGGMLKNKYLPGWRMC